MAQAWVQTLRVYHRWVSTAAIALLGWVALTGITLALDDLTAPKFPAPSAPLVATATPTLAQAGVRAAFATAQGARPAYVEVALSLRAGEPVIETRLDPTQPPKRLVIDPATGVAKPASPRAAPAGLSDYLKFRIALHKRLERLHRGNILGWTGQWLSVLTGLSFIFLVVSGAWIYLDMLLRRRRAGKRQLFWN